LIGILGGTFDPIHFGHLRLAQELADSLQLTEVRLIPAGNPWHREPPLASPAHRLAMARLGIAANPLFQLDDREVRRNALGYTVETLTEMRQEMGAKQPLCLLLGMDAFAGLHAWHRWKEIFALAHLVVVARPGTDLNESRLNPELWVELERRKTEDPDELRQEASGKIIIQPYFPLDISSTRIRQLLKSGSSPRYLLPDGVIDYIQAHQIYS
jgi:nicotinate-nucleotide adenylyltransferase